MQQILAAAQPERWAALSFSGGSTSNFFISVKANAILEMSQW
jgi:hypothetical protein